MSTWPLDHLSDQAIKTARGRMSVRRPAAQRGRHRWGSGEIGLQRLSELQGMRTGSAVP
jgi:hypothetical protein